MKNKPKQNSKTPHQNSEQKLLKEATVKTANLVAYSIIIKNKTFNSDFKTYSTSGKIFQQITYYSS